MATKTLELLRKAYALGFAQSGEGWNSEYPFRDGNEPFEADKDWVLYRDKDLKVLLTPKKRTKAKKQK